MSLSPSSRQHPLSRSPVEHCLHVFPSMNHFFRGCSTELHVSPPGVEVGCIRLDVLVTRTDPVGVEYELVWRKEEPTVGTLDAFCS